jgi:hypothetical protein
MALYGITVRFSSTLVRRSAAPIRMEWKIIEDYKEKN